MPRPGLTFRLALASAATGLLLLLWHPWRDTPAPAAAPVIAPPGPAPLPPRPVPPQPATAPAAPQPLPADHETALHTWSAEDARAPEVIRRLARNPDEERRLLEENPRVTGRRLVYRKEPVYVAVERARAAGQPLSRFALPGFDGRDLDVEITRADLEPSGLAGTFAGRLPGLGQSLVTLAFKNGVEAFTVLSPEDGTFLQGHPREPGEIYLTRFVPDSYLPLPGGEPIRTDESPKPAE